MGKKDEANTESTQETERADLGALSALNAELEADKAALAERINDLEQKLEVASQRPDLEGIDPKETLDWILSHYGKTDHRDLVDQLIQKLEVDCGLRDVAPEPKSFRRQ